MRVVELADVEQLAAILHPSPWPSRWRSRRRGGSSRATRPTGRSGRSPGRSPHPPEEYRPARHGSTPTGAATSPGVAPRPRGDGGRDGGGRGDRGGPRAMGGGASCGCRRPGPRRGRADHLRRRDGPGRHRDAPPPGPGALPQPCRRDPLRLPRLPGHRSEAGGAVRGALSPTTAWCTWRRGARSAPSASPRPGRSRRRSRGRGCVPSRSTLPARTPSPRCSAPGESQLLREIAPERPAAFGRPDAELAGAPGEAPPPPS